jgi:hypothetical protein
MRYLLARVDGANIAPRASMGTSVYWARELGG